MSDMHAAWTELAGPWERWQATLQAGYGPVSARLLELLDPPPGATLVEVAAGTGELGLTALRRAGDGARLVSTDVVEAMVDAVARRAAALGLAEAVEAREADAAALGLPDASVDGVLCESGLMLVDDPAAAAAEARRVLRPGAPLVASVWADPERNVWDVLAPRALADARGEAAPAPPGTDGTPGTFALHDEDELRRALGAAGFRDVHVEQVEVAFTFADADEHEAWAVDFGDLPPAEEQPPGLRAALDAARASYVDEDGRVTLPGLAHVVRASA